jgi:hypothetical protein
MTQIVSRPTACSIKSYLTNKYIVGGDANNGSDANNGTENNNGKKNCY